MGKGNQIPSFTGFIIDNSSSTNLKYDIVASKYMTGILNHSERQTLSAPFRNCVWDYWSRVVNGSGITRNFLSLELLNGFVEKIR